MAEEAMGLAGRGTDLVQRTIVYHHLFDHSGGRHAYALLCAEAALTLDSAIGAMRKAVRHSRWRLRGARREAAIARVEAFANAVSEIDRARCEAMWIAYRAAQHAATSPLVPDALGDLKDCDAAALFAAHQAWAEAQWGIDIEAAIAALDWPLSPAPVIAAVGSLRVSTVRFNSAARQGLRKVEGGILGDKRLPAKFAANPARHYYALQRAMAARRRDAQCNLDDFAPEDSVRLAAAA